LHAEKSRTKVENDVGTFDADGQEHADVRDAGGA